MNDGLLFSALIGAVASARSMTPMAAIAAARLLGRRTPGSLVLLDRLPMQVAALAMGAGELAGDKMRTAPDRTMRIGWLGTRPESRASRAARLGVPKRLPVRRHQGRVMMTIPKQPTIAMPTTDPLPLSDLERRLLRRRCDRVVPGFTGASPADEHRQVADWCAAHDVEHDAYGEGELVNGFERKIAALLGKDAAVFMPSGIMAQLAALRVWTERAGLRRFGVHPTSHLLHHENEAHAALMQTHAVALGDRLRPLLAPDLAPDLAAGLAAFEPLACVFVELPMREAGGRLPDWDELEALRAAAAARGIPLHMDGARLWECAAFYRRSYADIAAGFASVYVSLYKGIGAPAGAMLAGDAGLIAAARVWRRRMGGTLYHLGGLVAPAAMRFDERIALMPRLYERTLRFAAAMTAVPGLRLNPAVPQVNLLHLYFDAPPQRLTTARDAIAEERGCWLFDRARASEVPGWSMTEIYVGDRLLDVDDTDLAVLYDELMRRSRAP